MVDVVVVLAEVAVDVVYTERKEGDEFCCLRKTEENVAKEFCFFGGLGARLGTS